MKPLILHHGFDNLELSFRATAYRHILEFLAEAKKAALSKKSAQAIDLAGRSVTVSMSGGLGGYTYSVNTGPLGGIWWFKEANPKDEWAMRVSMHSLPLALFGLAAVKAEIDDFVLAVAGGCDPSHVTLSRVDYAIDLLLPEFELDPDHILCRGRATKLTNSDFREVSTSRRTTGVTIGKMPSPQVIIYDKSKEVSDKSKSEWPLIWENNSGLDEDALKNVWRFEFRSGKRGIEKLVGKPRWPLVAPQLNSLFEKIAKRVRLVCPSDDLNKSRWNNDEIWNQCLETLSTTDLNQCSSFDPEKVIEILRGEALEQLVDQHFGIETSLAGALGYTHRNFQTLIEKMDELRQSRITDLGSKFAEKIEEKAELWDARYSTYRQNF